MPRYIVYIKFFNFLAVLRRAVSAEIMACSVSSAITPPLKHMPPNVFRIIDIFSGKPLAGNAIELKWNLKLRPC